MPSAPAAVAACDLPVKLTIPIPPPTEARTKNPLAVLCGGRAILTDRRRWLRGQADVSAVDAAGAPCEPRDPRAVQWCLWGALDQAGGTDAASAAALLLVGRAIGLPRLDCVSVSAWADAPERTHGEILQALDAAVDLLARTPGGDETAAEDVVRVHAALGHLEVARALLGAAGCGAATRIAARAARSARGSLQGIAFRARRAGLVS